MNITIFALFFLHSPAALAAINSQEDIGESASSIQIYQAITTAPDMDLIPSENAFQMASKLNYLYSKTNLLIQEKHSLKQIMFSGGMDESTNLEPQLIKRIEAINYELTKSQAMINDLNAALAGND